MSRGEIESLTSRMSIVRNYWDQLEKSNPDKASRILLVIGVVPALVAVAIAMVFGAV